MRQCGQCGQFAGVSQFIVGACLWRSALQVGPWALYCAAKEKKSDVMCQLWDAGLSLSAGLLLAAKLGSAPCVSLMVECGAPVLKGHVRCALP